MEIKCVDKAFESLQSKIWTLNGDSEVGSLLVDLHAIKGPPTSIQPPGCFMNFCGLAIHSLVFSIQLNPSQSE